MISVQVSRIRECGHDIVLTGIGLILGLTGGLIAGHDRQLALLFVGGCLLLATVMTRPVVIGLFAVMGLFVVQRLGGAMGSNEGISYSDLLMAGATALAIPSLAVGPEVKRLRLPLIGLGIYLVSLLPAVLADDSTRGVLEWGHRLVLVGGALLVGAWLVREGYGRFALRLLIAIAAAVAALAVIDTLTHDLRPASPLQMNKNFVGAQLSIVFIVLTTSPRTLLSLAPPTRVLTAVVIAAGLVASQSRGAMLAAVAGIVFTIAFSPSADNRRGRGIVALVSLGLAIFVAFSVHSDLSEPEADRQNNSIGVRQKVEQRTLEIWRTSPVTGVGLKYFNSGEWGELAQAPNIVVDNELAESGIVGLGGFVVMQSLAITAGVLRRREPFVIVGTAVVVAALLHGLVDIYWTAATVSLPFLILGMALGGDGADQPPARARNMRSSAVART